MFTHVNILGVTTSERSRRTYHHGDLRNALMQAAADLAERGGPDAVTIRAAARAVGVTPTATYRHFTNQGELLEAAKEWAFAGMARAVTDYLAQIPESADPVERAVARFRASGRGYVRFALEQPGLFRTAFCRTPTSERKERVLGEVAPYALLTQMLDELQAVGYLDPDLREHAEAAAWSTVHGLALLLIDGALRDLTDDEREAVIERTLSMVTRGLAGGPNAP